MKKTEKAPVLINLHYGMKGEWCVQTKEKYTKE